MASVLLCGPDPFGDELHGTILWRDGIERHVANRFEDALTIAVALRPSLVVVDQALPRAERLVEDLRRDPQTRGCSIVVVARGDFGPSQIQLLAAGANAILELPASAEWDERLGGLLDVPARREARLRVQLQLEGRLGIETLYGTITNLSLNGILVETLQRLAIGTDLDIAFVLPSSGSVVAGTGQVVREAAPGTYGVRFYGLEGLGAEDIKSFVEEGGTE